MDLAEIRKLVRLMIRAELSELEIDDTNQGLRVHFKRGSAEGTPGQAATVQPLVQWMPGPTAGLPGAVPVTPGAEALPLSEDELPPGTESFDSPMVGTFYRAASPDAEPFVEVGTHLAEDMTLCIIEAMKVMNEIKSETKGEVVEILVENGEPIEFGQPLFLIKKA